MVPMLNLGGGNGQKQAAPSIPLLNLNAKSDIIPKSETVPPPVPVETKSKKLGLNF